MGGKRPSSWLPIFHNFVEPFFLMASRRSTLKFSLLLSLFIFHPPLEYGARQIRIKVEISYIDDKNSRQTPCQIIYHIIGCDKRRCCAKLFNSIPLAKFFQIA